MRLFFAFALLLSILAPRLGADPLSTSGKIKQQTFYVAWEGSGSWHQEAQDASVYAEQESDYDGQPEPFPGCCAIYILDDLYSDPDNFGRTFCTNGGWVDNDGYCTGHLRSQVNIGKIQAMGQSLRNTWCHEIGHGMGAGHYDTSISAGCLHDYVSEHYDSHHIQKHIQFEYVPH